jgi:hypothetical protein
MFWPLNNASDGSRGRKMKSERNLSLSPQAEKKETILRAEK